MKKAFKATIHLLIDADNEAEACDCLTALLTEPTDNSIIDWQYASKGDVFISPVETQIPDDYEEGSFEPVTDDEVQDAYQRGYEAGLTAAEQELPIH